MKSEIIISILSFIILIASCNKTELKPIEKDLCIISDSATLTYYYNGIYRQYLIYKPDSLPANAPLLFVLHGQAANAEKMYYLGFNKYADSSKFMICYPQANNCKWETDARKTTDVDFLRILAQYLQTKYNLSRSKTYVAGFSTGGTMTNLLAIDAGDVFKSAACIAGDLKSTVIKDCYPQYSIPTITLHGTADSVMPITGSTKNNTLSTQRMVDFWRVNNNCYVADTAIISSTTTAFRYKDTTSNKEIWYYIMNGQGHIFPGDSSKRNEDIAGFNGFSEIWKFLSKW